jgi:two-component system invasion response regulator UvrY
MNLHIHLLSRIAAVALICLLADSAYVLQRSNQQSRHILRTSAESLGRQLEFQLLRIDAGFGQARAFPDFSLWKETAAVPGLCIRYEPADTTAVKNLCHGAKVSQYGAPASFASLYRAFFAPGLEIARPVVFKGRTQGILVISSSAEMDIAQAWSDVRNLLGLSALTILAVCLPVYLSINRALRPAGIIVAGLETLRKGNLAYRLPPFELQEWSHTAAAINQLAAAQQQLLAERQKLAVQLIDLQEQERRYLARELHDEFGQCLAAINAVAASTIYTAERECPALLAKQTGLQVIAEAADGVEAYLRFKECKPDLMVTDLSLPGVGGLELIGRFKQRCPDARILVFSMHQNPSFAIQASRAGALGYVTKSSPPKVLLRAIVEVHAGRHALSPDIAQALALEKLGNGRMALETLTVREFEILRLLVEGRSAETIAEILHLSPKTVCNSHYLIKRKLGAASDIELMRQAIRLDVIDLLELSGATENPAA